MQDHPPLAGNGHHNHHDRNSAHRQPGDSGISLWIAAATVIISLGVLLVFSQGHLKNGGGPFVITPSTEISAYPASGL
ncbi:hypothetical protein [Hoeflea alexandrii]|uniref:hypothetical protein n=1 Tax=Hoeflea alexandrii TaxID=288436 RepID=UPI0022AEBF8B|nr:hypothetical protein [Hoeflea alexandrii]MCZ4288656.1 hypothetical protein [Hoeflea alexandrii]